MNSQNIITFFLQFQEDLKNVAYKDSIVGILDILGFKNAIKNEDEESLKLLQKSISSELFTNKSLVNFENIKINMVSDTFIVASDEINALSVKAVITILENIRRGLMMEGFLSRGSVVSGKHFLKNGILISPAFIKAYEIEEKEAIYPRIIIENALVNLLRESKNEEKEIFFPEKLIEKDFDGYFVVRPFVQIQEVAAFCDEKIYKEKTKTDDFKNLEDSFKNQIDSYRTSLKECYEKISKDSQHQMGKINYSITKYNRLLELCRFYKDKKFLDTMQITNQKQLEERCFKNE